MRARGFAACYDGAMPSFVRSARASTLARLLLLLAASAPFACSSTSSQSGDPASVLDAGDAAAAADASQEVGHDDATPADSATSDDTGPGFMLDTAPMDTATCSQLNIGILGKAGSNASSNFQSWLQKSGTTVQRIQTTTGQPLTAATLQPFDVVILDWLPRDYTTAEAAILATWISAGGGVASMSGYDNNTTDDWHANSLLAPLGVGYGGPLRSGPVTDFATHPITAGLTSVTFNGGYAVSDLGGSASSRTPIAFLADPSGKVTAGFAVQMGAGRAFVWGDEWIEFDSEWSTLPAIKQLWVQIFGWVAPTNKCALVPPS